MQNAREESDILVDYDQELVEDEQRQRSKSALRLNRVRDIPLLLEIRNSTFISHQQLLDFLTKAGIEHNPRAFYWRVNRFIEGEYIRNIGNILPYAGRVYTITRLGMAVLESCGEGLVSVGPESRTLPNVNQAPHFLELNEIRRTLQDGGKLLHWKSDRELASINYAVGTPLAKDYDAVAELDLGGEPFRLAIEYERTIKTSARYQEIMKAIRDESQVDMVLYLTSKVEQVFILCAEFKKPEIPMGFAAARKFQEYSVKAMSVFSYGEMRKTIPIEEALKIAASVRG